jgi:hypothetical protein
VGVTENDIR